MPTCNDCEWFKYFMYVFDYGLCVINGDKLCSKSNSVCTKFRPKEK